MITVKLYGLLRLDSGIRACQLEADTLSQVFTQLEARGLSRKALSGCVVLVNGRPARRHQPLSPGDTIQLLPPVAGG